MRPRLLPRGHDVRRGVRAVAWLLVPAVDAVWDAPRVGGCACACNPALAATYLAALLFTRQQYSRLPLAFLGWQVHAGPRYGASFNHWYNEVIFDASAVARDPPAAIEGFFLMDGSGGGQLLVRVGKGLAASNRLVRAAHAEFLRKFGLDAATGPPLLLLEPEREEPFSLCSVDGHGACP